MVKIFLAGQASIGNAEKGPIRFIEAHQVGVIWGFWLLWVAGLAVALPTMVRTGFFTDLGGSDGAKSAGDQELAREIARMPVQGTLVAAPGMTSAEMIGGSSLKTNPAVPGEAVYAGGAIFDFWVAGTAIDFHRCRYYYVTTYAGDREHIEAINIGTSPKNILVRSWKPPTQLSASASRPTAGSLVTKSTAMNRIDSSTAARPGARKVTCG